MQYAGCVHVPAIDAVLAMRMHEQSTDLRER
jgi:hypothetical protein